MPKFIINQTLSVDVEMSIEAENAEDARQKFNDGIALNTSMVNDVEFDVYEDSMFYAGEMEITEE